MLQKDHCCEGWFVDKELDMYEKFTDRARKVMQLASSEAQRWCHPYIGPEHILLGLVREGSGVAAGVFKRLGVELSQLRLGIEKLVECGTERELPLKLPQTPAAKRVIEYSMEEARSLNHKHIGTEHILLGLLRENEGVAARVLRNLGCEFDVVCKETLELLGLGENDVLQAQLADIWKRLLAGVDCSEQRMPRFLELLGQPPFFDNMRATIEEASRLAKEEP